jgi:hypothetical protein
MLRMENFHMTRALTSVGGPLHSADGPARSNPRPYPLAPTPCISNRNYLRIEIAATHSKQTTATISNRNSFRGGPSVAYDAKFGVRRLAAALLRPGSPGRAPRARRGKPRPMKARASSRTPQEAKKRLIATHANSEIATTHSQQRTSLFLTATQNTFPNSRQRARDMKHGDELRQGQEKNAGWKPFGCAQDKPALRGHYSRLTTHESRLSLSGARSRQFATMECT